MENKDEKKSIDVIKESNKEEGSTMKFIVQGSNTSNAPQYVEKLNRSGYITYGEDNLYGEYLISLMNYSAKHNAILKTKAMMIGGNGIDLTGLDPIAMQFVANPYNELDLNEIMFRCAYDLELFGAFSIEVIYSKDKKLVRLTEAELRKYTK